MAVIDLKVKDLYPVLKPTVVKIESEGVLNPQTANRIGYEFLHDVKAVRDAHNNKSVPPFAIKKLQRNSFELHIMIPVSETALYIHAERMGVKIYSIEYPKFNIPSVYNVEGVDIIFTSPTSFRWDQKHIPYFESLLFWRSCLKLWSLFTGHKIEEQDRMVNVLAAEVYTVFTDLNIVRYEIMGKKVFYKGFKGSVQLAFSEALSSESKVFILTLLHSAAHTGVGIKRAWGMGNLEWQPVSGI